MKILDRDPNPWVVFQPCLSGRAEAAVAPGTDVLDDELATDRLWDHVRISQTAFVRLKADDAAIVLPGKKHLST